MAKHIARRTVLKHGGAGLAGLALPASLIYPAWATPQAVQALIDGHAGGKPVSEKGLAIEAPIIADNGASVEVILTAESPMTDSDYIKAIYLYADGNPNPEVAGFRFTPESGLARVEIQIRLAKTQNVIALAESSDGSFRRAQREVKVTIGGCAGG